jgi:dienelactone hydrolase
MSPRSALVAVGVALLAACTPALKDLKASLGTEDAGTVSFASAGSLVSAPNFTFAPGEPVVLSGDLTLPAGAGPFPAVILMHGCGGVGNAETGWVPALRRAGYASFVVDSFTGRGLREVCTQSRTLVSVQRVPDAYGALRILATHPRLASDRIALMGFSHGGILTLAASTEWARRTYAPPGRPAFRAFLPFYPSCNATSPDLGRISAPLRIHSGELDDWTPAAPCRELVASLRASGQDAEITVYPGAHHSFDNIGRPLMYLGNVDSGAGCRLRAASLLGPLLNPEELRTCLRKGATIGYNPAATEEARRNVLAELPVLLRAR